MYKWDGVESSVISCIKERFKAAHIKNIYNKRFVVYRAEFSFEVSEQKLTLGDYKFVHRAIFSTLNRSTLNRTTSGRR